MTHNLYWESLAFLIFVILTIIIPLWGSIFAKKSQPKATKANFVFATGAVSIFSMILSVARGNLGSKTFLGYPSELFYRGSGMWETMYGMVLAHPVVAYVFIPVYFNLGITSVYQYIELRFKSRLVRCLASGTYIFRTILNLGVAVYTPAIALYTIIGVPIWMSLMLITVLTIIFILMGGLKAAITADVIQILIFVFVSCAIVIQSTVQSGGVSNVYYKNKNSGRLDFFKFTGDWTIRVDTTSAIIGQLFMAMSRLGCQQNFVQRYLSMKSIKEVSRMIMANVPVVILLFSLSWVVGMGIYSVYSDCDPLRAGITKSADAIVPFYIEDKFSFIPGIIGIFLASLFTNSLALSVFNTNSLATVTWEDFLSKLPQFKDIKDSRQLKIIKIIGTVYTILTMGVGFSVQLLSGVIECAQLMTSSTSGPLLGIFILAILIPFANWKGAASGMIISQIIITVLTVGHLSKEKSVEFLETSISGCGNETFSSFHTTSSSNSWMMSHINKTADVVKTKSLFDEYDGFPHNMFSISYMYYSFLGTFLTVTIGIFVSYWTLSDDDAYNCKFIHPAIYKITKYFKSSSKLFSQEKTELNNNQVVSKKEHCSQDIESSRL